MAVQQAAFDFIARVQDIQTTGAIVAELGRLAEDEFGCEGFFIAGLPDPGERLDPYMLLSRWPQGWTERYLENDYVHADPVVERFRSSSMPFTWGEASSHPADAGAARVMNEAPAFGLRDGFAVPIFTALGMQAGVSFFSPHALELSAEQRGALHLIAIYAHGCARAILDREAERRARPTEAGKRALAKPRRTLSQRELECLRWAAAGKSAWETSTILSLSERTVKQAFRAKLIG
jgi:LuxR family transcriptional regulator, quorum-sensing system regulator BjaR1